LDSVPTVALIVGLVPAGVASILSALHLFARLRDRRSGRLTRERALRKLVYSHVLSHPNCVDPEAIGGRGSDAAVTRILDELAGTYGADIEEIGEDHYLYRFREIAREMRELAEARATEAGQASAIEPVVPSSSRY
jgi:hypothetical protein